MDRPTKEQVDAALDDYSVSYEPAPNNGEELVCCTLAAEVRALRAEVDALRSERLPLLQELAKVEAELEAMCTAIGRGPF